MERTHPNLSILDILRDNDHLTGLPRLIRLEWVNPDPDRQKWEWEHGYRYWCRYEAKGVDFKGNTHDFWIDYGYHEPTGVWHLWAN